LLPYCHKHASEQGTYLQGIFLLKKNDNLNKTHQNSPKSLFTNKTNKRILELSPTKAEMPNKKKSK